MRLSRRQILAATAGLTTAPGFLPLTPVLAPALAQTPQVTLRVHHFLGPQSNQHRDWLAPWAEKIGRESAGRIKVEVYPSMQLGGRAPQLFDQAKDGVVDIVWTLAGNTPGRFPRLEVFELPFIASNLGLQTSQAVWDYQQKYAAQELKDVQVLGVFTHGRGNLYTKDRKIQKVEDVKGLKVRVPSRPINDTMQLVGALPQAIPAPGVPEALAKGVVDGVVMTYEIVPALKLDELTRHVAMFEGNRSLYTVVFLFVMNKARYASLPEDLRKVIDANSGEGLSRWLGGMFDEWDKLGIAAVEKAGMEVSRIGGADLEQWKTASRPVVDSWVEARNKAGDNGAELLKAAQDLVARSTP